VDGALDIVASEEKVLGTWCHQVPSTFSSEPVVASEKASWHVQLHQQLALQIWPKANQSRD
jgi:hypothetical protein